jgi:hypothetical protein
MSMPRQTKLRVGVLTLGVTLLFQHLRHNTVQIWVRRLELDRLAEPSQWCIDLVYLHSFVSDLYLSIISVSVPVSVSIYLYMY